METKIINIKDICPEGYKLDKERSTLDNLVFIEDINYNYVSEKLFLKHGYYCDSCGHIRSIDVVDYGCQKYLNMCTSEKQAKKLLAINQLLNIAKYLNGDWQPNWDNNNENKYTIYIDRNNTRILIDFMYVSNKCIVYFKTEELAQRAINILGEETIKLALSTDW